MTPSLARYPILITLVLILILSACNSETSPAPTPTPTQTAQSPQFENPTATPTSALPTSIPPSVTASPSATAMPSNPTAPPTPAWTPTWTPEPDFAGLRITFIHNAGFLIESADQKVLIDAIFRGYQSSLAPRADLLDAMVAGTPPFDQLDLILVTHEHRDHFDAELVYQHLLRNPDTQLVSTTEVVASLVGRNAALAERLQAVDLHSGQSQALSAAGIELQAFYISHGDPAITNLGFFFRMGKYHLFHSGDLATDSIQVSELQAFGLPDYELDVAFVPAYSLLDPGLQAYTTDGLRPTHVIPMHYSYQYPPLDLPETFPGAVVFANTMHRWVLPEGSTELIVPAGPQPVLDGIIDAAEWGAASLDPLPAGGELYLMQDGEFLYVGLRAPGTGGGASNLFVGSTPQVALLHSSAALGTARYQADGEAWHLSQGFTWSCRRTDLSAAARSEQETFLASEGWLASNGRMGASRDYEFMLPLPETGVRLSLAYIGPPMDDRLVTWPAGLQDDSQNSLMVTGPLPEEASFALEQWPLLVPAQP